MKTRDEDEGERDEDKRERGKRRDEGEERGGTKNGGKSRKERREDESNGFQEVLENIGGTGRRGNLQSEVLWLIERHVCWERRGMQGSVGEDEERSRISSIAHCV